MRKMRTIKQEVVNPLGIRSRSNIASNSLDGGWGGARRSTFAVERWLLKAMLGGLGNPPVTISTWDGCTVKNVTTSPAPHRSYQLHLNDAGNLVRLLLDPEYQFGELYSAGRIEVDGDLAGLVEAIFIAQRRRESRFNTLLRRFHAPRSNIHQQSTHNIHHHYDIGNDFYRLWLDSELVYTCAYFPDPTVTLERAQADKMALICRKLRLQAGERVVEAGCGWGALALYMAREYGVRVRAYNISSQQIEYARQRARDEGLQDRVSFIQADYRDIRGEHDVFVSVGMLEHVGLGHYREFGKVIDRCLGQRGRGLVHAIGTNAPTPLNAWIERRIFPGAYPPALSEMMAVFEPANLSVLDVENLRLHYAKTLEHWLHRFEASADLVESMFDPVFVRAWRLYLSGSLAAFRTGKLQLFQVVFQRGHDNNVAWSRASLYQNKNQDKNQDKKMDKYKYKYHGKCHFKYHNKIQASRLPCNISTF
jgi:cyclopropane-fatty-acyl-phospholipid synthase